MKINFINSSAPSNMKGIVRIHVNQNLKCYYSFQKLKFQSNFDLTEMLRKPHLLSNKKNANLISQMLATQC